jgi:hypothetical protein
MQSRCAGFLVAAALALALAACNDVGSGLPLDTGPTPDATTADQADGTSPPDATGTDTPDPDVAQDAASPDTGPSCNGVLWEGTCVDPGGEGDNLTFVGGFNGSSFNELVEVEHVGGYVFYCAGTKGLSIYDSPPNGASSYIVHSGQLGLGSNSQYPRCQHLAFGEVAADPAYGEVNVFVTNRGDETQPTPWLKWVRFSNGIAAIAPSYNSINLPVVSTLNVPPAR